MADENPIPEPQNDRPEVEDDLLPEVNLHDPRHQNDQWRRVCYRFGGNEFVCSIFFMLTCLLQNAGRAVRVTLVSLDTIHGRSHRERTPIQQRRALIENMTEISYVVMAAFNSLGLMLRDGIVIATYGAASIVFYYTNTSLAWHNHYDGMNDQYIMEPIRHNIINFDFMELVEEYFNCRLIMSSLNYEFIFRNFGGIMQRYNAILLNNHEMYSIRVLRHLLSYNGPGNPIQYLIRYCEGIRHRMGPYRENMDDLASIDHNNRRNFINNLIVVLRRFSDIDDTGELMTFMFRAIVAANSRDGFPEVPDAILNRVREINDRGE